MMKDDSSELDKDEASSVGPDGGGESSEGTEVLCDVIW